MARIGTSLLAILITLTTSFKASGAVFNVRDNGARGDKKTNDRAAIQSAIEACAKAGGGTVLFPPGDYLSGTIRLRSNVTLEIAPGATLWASTERRDYDGRGSGHLLFADGAEHISILGSGTIHGQGTADLGRRKGVKEEMPAFRTGILLFQNCRNVTIRDITILYSDAWTIHLKRCDTVFIDGVTILNNYFRTNSDGIDPNSCRNVHISNCHIVAGDDCIVLKTTEPYPCEDVVVTNCTLETIATALKLGTESRGDFRNVHFSNCTIRNSGVGIGFYMKDGATMERVTFSNISIETSTPTLFSVYPIFMDIEKRNADSPIGRIRDIVFSNIQIHSGMGSLIQGMPENPIENLTMQNITVRVDDTASYAKRSKHIGGRRTYRDERDTRYARQPSYITLAHVRDLILDNVRVYISESAFHQFERSAVSGHQLENGTIRSIYREPAGTGGKLPVIALEDCRQMLVTACQAAQGTPAFLALRGKQTAGISLLGSDLTRAVRATSQSAEVPEGAVTGPRGSR
jgi:1-acyl-sn-glycerol-3-phosphate acyltransferase